jgi:hypothetical protein
MIYLFLFLGQIFAIDSFEHSYVLCDTEEKVRKVLFFNAFTNPQLCQKGMIAYPASVVECSESNELIDKCTKPMECKAKFICRVTDNSMNQRELIKMVKNDVPITPYQVIDPLIPVIDTREFEVEAIEKKPEKPKKIMRVEEALNKTKAENNTPKTIQGVVKEVIAPTPAN